MKNEKDIIEEDLDLTRRVIYGIVDEMVKLSPESQAFKDLDEERKALYGDLRYLQTKAKFYKICETCVKESAQRAYDDREWERPEADYSDVFWALGREAPDDDTREANWIIRNYPKIHEELWEEYYQEYAYEAKDEKDMNATYSELRTWIFRGI